MGRRLDTRIFPLSGHARQANNSIYQASELETLMAWIETLNPEKIRFPANGSDATGVIFN
ncbi:MAG: hypothetical protein KME31_25240 [Tolypothrix carrinoi HA7290-LM1]|jgi:hypothetical protein|nr:hypothetical protein [Tolypothrix carrinoi HA7290-LM1]